MGKIEIKKELKIDHSKVFGKRHRGLIKKAYELSVLCGVDVAVIMYSPGDVLRQFSSHPRLEKILQRFVLSIPKMPENERENLQISQDIINRINLVAGPADMEDQRGPDASGEQELNPEIVDLQKKLMLLKEQLKMLDPGVEAFGSEQQFEEHIQWLDRIRSIIVNKRHQNEYERSFQIPFTNPLQIVQNNNAQIKSEPGLWGPVYGGEQLQGLDVQFVGYGDPSSSFDQAPLFPREQTGGGVSPFMPYLVSSEVTGAYNFDMLDALSRGNQEQGWQHGMIGDPSSSSYPANNQLFGGQNAQNGMGLYGGGHWTVRHLSPASCSSMQISAQHVQTESQAGTWSSLQGGEQLQHPLLHFVKTEQDAIYPPMFTAEQTANVSSSMPTPARWEVGGPSDAVTWILPTGGHQEPVQQHVTKQDPCSSAYPANNSIFNGEQNSVFGQIKLETTRSSPVSNILAVPPGGHREENTQPAAGHPPSTSQNQPESTVALENLTWEDILESTGLENLTWDEILQARAGTNSSTE